MDHIAICIVCASVMLVMDYYDESINAHRVTTLSQHEATKGDRSQSNRPRLIMNKSVKAVANPSHKAGIGDVLTRKIKDISSKNALLAKKKSSTTPAKQAKSILRATSQKFPDGCGHSRRIRFKKVINNDGTNWAINSQCPDKSHGMDAFDLMAQGVISEDEFNRINEYQGYCPYFRPIKSANGELSLSFPVVDMAQRENEYTFFDNYVMNRVPAKLTGPIRGGMWAMEKDSVDSIAQWADLSYLKTIVGDQLVMVERTKVSDKPEKKKKKKKSRKAHSFGHGIRQPMAFNEFIDRLEKKDETLYLSAQPTSNGVFPKAMVEAPLAGGLMLDFPRRPKAIGPLLPHRYNLWMGSSRDTTSGLHVDMHDNLYRLISGKKTFRLYSPAFLALIGLRGHVEKLYSNGLPILEGHDPVRADGSSLMAAKVWRMCERIKNRLVLCGEVSQGGKTQMLRLPTKWIHPMEGLWHEEQDDIMDECREDFELGMKDQQHYPDHFAKRNTGEHRILKGRTSIRRGDLTSLLQKAALQDNVREFILNEMWIDVTLNAGESLYMPAGWAHEVISTTDPNSAAHTALNIWFHPPAIVGNPEFLDREGDIKRNSKNKKGTAVSDPKPNYVTEFSSSVLAEGGSTSEETSSSDDSMPEGDQFVDDVDFNEMFKNDDAEMEEAPKERYVYGPDSGVVSREGPKFTCEHSPSGLYVDGYLASVYGVLKRNLWNELNEW